MVTQAYKIKIGNAEMILPDLNVESFDGFVRSNISQENVDLIRARVLGRKL